MPERQWKPGDVAMVSRVDMSECVAMWGGWNWQCATAGEQLDMNIRPRRLVVLDPESRSDVVNLAQAVGAATAQPGEDIRHIINAVARHLRSLVADPKPEEPTGLGAVVLDGQGVKFIRTERYERQPWDIAGEKNGGFPWSGVDAVEVLSEGVQP